MITKKIWVRQIRMAVRGIRFLILRTCNLPPMDEYRIGHTLTEHEVLECNRKWEVEIS